MATIQDDFKVYTDPNGLVQPTPGSQSGNGLLFTAEAIAAFKAHNVLDPIAVDKFIAAYRTCETQPGLYHRRPDGVFGQEAQDDYIGIAYASRYLNRPEIAQRVLDYGNKGALGLQDGATKGVKILYNVLSIFGLKSIKNVWNNEQPGKFSINAWLGRTPTMIVDMKFAAGVEPGIFEKLYWCVAMLYSMKNDIRAHDSWVLSWMSWKTAEGKSWLCDFVGKIWLKKFNAYYPNGMGQLLSDYFVNPAHPSAIYLQGVH
jgi:hypothetical protein